MTAWNRNIAPSRRGMEAAAGVVGEIGFTGVLVVLCAVALWSVTQRFLPAGTSFGDLVARNSYLERDMRDRLFGNALQPSPEATPSEQALFARLSTIDNRVKIKQRNDIAWAAAARGQRLQVHDAVQTFENSRARIEFAHSGRLQLDQNSLVVLRGLRRREGYSNSREIVMEIEGRFNGRITRTMNSNEFLKVVLPRAVMKARAIDGTTIDLDVTVDADNNSRVAVYQGAAKITTQSEQVYVDRDNVVSIDSDTGRTESVQLESPLELKSPADGAVVYYRSSPKPVTFRWSHAVADARYRLEIANDERLSDIVFDRIISGERFVHGSLSAGRYYWTVTVDGAGERSQPGDVRSLVIVKDNVKPVLRTDPLPARIEAAEVTIAGTTEAGASLFIDGRRVPTNDDGSFAETIELKLGTQVLVIESIDAAGNTAYQAHTITRVQ